MILRIARGKVGHRQTPIQQNPIQLITEWGFVLFKLSKLCLSDVHCYLEELCVDTDNIHLNYTGLL